MRRHILANTLALLLLSLPTAAWSEEQRVYRWTDADGVVHYSQVEPERVNAEARDIKTHQPAATAATAAEARPQSATEKSCEQARANTKLLDANQSVGFDRDGDGAPEPMSAEERQAAITLSQQQVRVYCGEE